MKQSVGTNGDNAVTGSSPRTNITSRNNRYDTQSHNHSASLMNSVTEDMVRNLLQQERLQRQEQVSQPSQQYDVSPRPFLLNNASLVGLPDRNIHNSDVRSQQEFVRQILQDVASTVDEYDSLLFRNVGGAGEDGTRRGPTDSGGTGSTSQSPRYSQQDTPPTSPQE